MEVLAADSYIDEVLAVERGPVESYSLTFDPLAQSREGIFLGLQTRSFTCEWDDEVGLGEFIGLL